MRSATAAPSLLAVGCARLPRRGRFSQLGRLAYPLLAATGVKLLLVDVRLLQAATLFAGLACYGAALVLVPRLRKDDGATVLVATAGPRVQKKPGG